MIPSLDGGIIYFKSLKMDLTDILHAIDLLGTFVFAISGVITSSRHHVEIFGASVYSPCFVWKKPYN